MQSSSQMKSLGPPKKFKPVKGLIAANVVDEPQFVQGVRAPTGVKGKGIRYEARVVEYLERDLPDTWVGIPGMWFEFVDGSGNRFAQPDWLGFDVPHGLIVIAEMKLTRVRQAWWQLNRLYQPLVRKVFPEWDIALVEITTEIKNVSIPESVSLIQSITHAKPNKTQVMRLPYDC